MAHLAKKDIDYEMANLSNFLLNSTSLLSLYSR